MGSLSGRKPAVPLPKDPEERRKIYVDSLRAAAAELGTASFSKERYDVAARRLGLVSGSPIKKDFGTWTAALAAAFGSSGPGAGGGAAPAAPGGEAAAVISAAEETLKAAAEFKTLTQFYMVVALRARQNGAKLGGKEICGIDSVSRILRRFRPDLVGEARKRAERSFGSPEAPARCAALMERKLAEGVWPGAVLEKPFPPGELAAEVCVATGADPDTIRKAWRRVRAKILGAAEPGPGRGKADPAAALRKIRRAAEAAAGEIEALRAKVRGLEEEREALAARARKLEEENAKLADTVQRCRHAFDTLLSMASEREKIEGLRIAVDHCLNVLSVVPVRKAEAARG